MPVTAKLCGFNKDGGSNNHTENFGSVLMTANDSKDLLILHMTGTTTATRATTTPRKCEQAMGATRVTRATAESTVRNYTIEAHGGNTLDMRT